MAFMDDLLKDGPHYRAKLGDGTIYISAKGGSASEIEAFQAVVKEIQDREGEGYSVVLPHTDSDVTGLIDGLLLQIEK